MMGINALLKAEMSQNERLLGFSAVALALVSFGCVRWFQRFLPVLPDQRVRSAIQWVFMILALAWLPIYTYAVLPGLSLTLGQLIVATLWSINLPPIVLGLTRGMDEAVRRRA